MGAPMAEGGLESWAFATARNLLEESLPRRWSHVQGVCARAKLACVMLSASEAEVLVTSAILHDIGYSPAISATGFHSLDGAQFLANEGAPERICALVAHHSCAHLEAELRGRSGELLQWVDEDTSVRDALWWADMTTTPDGEPTNVYDRIEEIQKRYGPEDLVTFFIRQAKPQLVGAVERTEARLSAAGVDYMAK